MTFSIVARDPDAHSFGVAVASSSPAVAARCAHARTNAGAVATQNITDPALGPMILEILSRGGAAHAAVERVMTAAPFAQYRQVLGISAEGPPALYCGEHVLGLAGSAVGLHAAAAGNLLARSDVPNAMLSAFEAAAGHLGSRLIAALRAGFERGGEAGPIHSAGLLVVREMSWPVVDLRVDWSDDDPIAQLERVWGIYAPQIDDYVLRAIDPARAPGFS